MIFSACLDHTGVIEGYNYPVKTFISLPPIDVINTALTDLDIERASNSKAEWPQLDKLFAAGYMLTDGFSRSAAGWEVIDIESKINSQYPNNSLFANADELILEDGVDIPLNDRLEWIEYWNFHVFNRTNTLEKRKIKGDVECASARQMFSYLDIFYEKDDEKKPTATSHLEKVSEEGERIDKRSRSYKRGKQMQSQADPNWPKIGTINNHWMDRFASKIVEWDTVDSKTEYGKLAQLIKHYMFEPSITDFDNAYLENAGKAVSNRKIYPGTFQPQRVSYSDWSKFAEYQIKTMGSASSDNEFQYVLELIGSRIWCILLTFVSKKFKQKDKKTLAKREDYFVYVCDLVKFYHDINLIETKRNGIVKPWLQNNYIIAYIMQKIKWMLICAQTYLSLFENKKFVEKIISTWLGMKIADSYYILAKIADCTKYHHNQYLLWLKTEGLKFLFENVFSEEIDNWMKYNTQAYNYKTLFCLPVDWKKPQEEKKDNGGTGTGTKRTNMEDGDGDEEDGDGDLPAKKRRKIMFQNKEQFKDTCTGFMAELADFYFNQTANENNDSTNINTNMEIDSLKLSNGLNDKLVDYYDKQIAELEKFANASAEDNSTTNDKNTNKIPE